jgi:hypothetical protein
MLKLAKSTGKPSLACLWVILAGAAAVVLAIATSNVRAYPAMVTAFARGLGQVTAHATWVVEISHPNFVDPGRKIATEGTLRPSAFSPRSDVSWSLQKEHLSYIAPINHRAGWPCS